MKWHRILSQLQKFWYITVNRIDRIFDIVYWPILDLFVWGFASYYIQDLSKVNLLSMFMGGIILWVFVWRSGQDIAVFVLEDFWSKNLYHLYSTPIKISEHVAATIIISVVRSLATFGVLTIMAALMYGFNIFQIPFLLLTVSILMLSLFAWCLGMFVTSLILRMGQRIQVMAWSIVWAVQPFSCIFYPLSALPPWARGVAAWLPTTAVFENVRASLFGQPMDTMLLWRAAGVNIILLALAALFLKSSFEHAKSSGLLARGD